VNLLGHTFVARATGGDDPEFLLGAALPDLAPMAGIRPDRARMAGALGEGVRCHLRTDDHFHGHPEVRRGMRALREDLRRRGVGSGPARAVGHAGWELLLDGTLVAGPTVAAFGRALEAGEAVAPVLAPDDRDRWAAFVARARQAPPPRYDDPGWVADRLHGMLARRPRLALPAAEVATVAAALAGHAGAVRAAAAGVLGDTVAAVGFLPRGPVS
jgi:hypothetical protein